MNDKELVMAAAALARFAPVQWKHFLEALGDYTDGKCIDCIQAPTDMLYVAQGRAQGLASLMRVLDSCLKTAESVDAAAALKNNKK